MKWSSLASGAFTGLLVFCAVALAADLPSPPDGYTVAADSGAWLFRPAGEGDPELAIRVYPRVRGDRTPAAVLAEWLAAHPATGKAPSPATNAPGVSVTTRATMHGRRAVHEMVTALQITEGTHMVMCAAFPDDRVKFRQRQGDAATAIGRAIKRDEVPDPPDADGTERARVASAAPSRPAPRTAAPAPAATPRATPPAARSATEARSAALGVESTIATVGFDTRARMGAGGMIMAVPIPVVLFKSGEAVADIEALSHPGGLAGHRAENPDDWGRWRRSGANIEMSHDGAWKRLEFTTTMDRLPAGFRLQGRWRSLSGVGNVAMGGTASVTAWSDLTFDRAGRFTSGGGAGSSSESPDGNTRVTTGASQPDRSGQYSIEGYTLTLRYDSGRVERRLIVADPADTKTIWLDGDGWVRR